MTQYKVREGEHIENIVIREWSPACSYFESLFPEVSVHIAIQYHCSFTDLLHHRIPRPAQSLRQAQHFENGELLVAWMRAAALLMFACSLASY